jgi:transposase
MVFVTSQQFKVQMYYFISGSFKEKMDNKNVHFRHIMLFYFKKGKNATQTQGKICAVYGENAVNERTCRKWLARFRAGNFDLDNAPRSARPVEVDDDQIKILIENNPP